jgi:phage FluMu gp28-like protein
MDIGRTRNATELFLVASDHNKYPLRFALTFQGWDFDSQLEGITFVMEKLPIAKLQIDMTGIGYNLAENAMKRYPGKVYGVSFSNQLKQLWATDAKMLFQQKRVPLPVDREIAYQCHSIKKMVTASKSLVFDTDRNEKHHADKFWALALAWNSARAGGVTLMVPESVSLLTY